MKKEYLKPVTEFVSLKGDALLDGIGFGPSNEQAGAKYHFDKKSKNVDNWADESNRHYQHSVWDD